MNKINKNNINKTNKIKAKEATNKQNKIIIICKNLYMKKHERTENIFCHEKSINVL